MRKMVNKILVRCISADYDNVIANDFNPDFVHLFGMDCMEKGFLAGSLITSACLTLIFTAGVVGYRRAKAKDEEES